MGGVSSSECAGKYFQHLLTLSRLCQVHLVLLKYEHVGLQKDERAEKNKGGIPFPMASFGIPGRIRHRLELALQSSCCGEFLELRLGVGVACLWDR